MRARRTLRAPGAAKLACGAVVLTFALAAVVVGSDSPAARGAQSRSQRGQAQGTASTRSARSSVAHPAAVSRFVIGHGAIVRPIGSTVVLHGLLMPGQSGSRVTLIARADGHWRTVASGRTLRNGRFRIRYRVHAVGSTPVRVAFSGTRVARAATAGAGRIVAVEPTVASWYYDEGDTACGFHATYGVANKTLPCGTRVTLAYGGRTVVATVDDRGPYVYGRSFDLDQNTARALGMWGVAQVYASV